MKQLIDIDAQRRKLKSLESKQTRQAQVWKSVKRFAREKPDENPWLTPFVALIDERDSDIANAKTAIDDYLARAESVGNRGYLFNIWCFAFPHCRWAMWFDMLNRAGFYTQDEADAIAAKFLLIQFRDHHAGLLIKPFPQCVDNQAAALALSSYVVGSIFAEGPGDGHLARKMRDEAAPRLEAMIGGMPKSGYSGEGSTYQGLIVAFAVPLLLEMLEDSRGEDLFEAPLWPNGTSPKSILQMTKRCWTPGGLLLPWDDYGYQFGITFPISYLAHRTGDQQCMQMLEHSANWTRMNITSSGWGYDEPVWTLIYWPEYDDMSDSPEWTCWVEDELGGVLVDPKGENYLMQMWDETGFMCSRAQVNPNSLILVHKGIPFSADGSATDDCTALNYDGAVFERTFGAGAHQVMNLSKGTAGSHNCILVDGNEGMRPHDDYDRSGLSAFDEIGKSITGNVTGLYKSVYEDCRNVQRQSRLVDDRFWLVQDTAEFENEHEFTSRWWFRPDCTAVEGGVDVQTAEGGLLQLRCVDGNGDATITRIDGFPKEPDGCSDRVDFVQSGKRANWTYVLWPTTTTEVVNELTTGWTAGPVEDGAGYNDIQALSGDDIEPGFPPWFQKDVSISRTWGFRTVVNVDGTAEPILKLPRGLDENTEIWLNGKPFELKLAGEQKLISQYVDCTAFDVEGGELEIAMVVHYAIGQDEHGSGMSIPDESLAICQTIDGPDVLESAELEGGALCVTTTHSTYEVAL